MSVDRSSRPESNSGFAAADSPRAVVPCRAWPAVGRFLLHSPRLKRCPRSRVRPRSPISWCDGCDRRFAEAGPGEPATTVGRSSMDFRRWRWIRPAWVGWLEPMPRAKVFQKPDSIQWGGPRSHRPGPGSSGVAGVGGGAASTSLLCSRRGTSTPGPGQLVAPPWSHSVGGGSGCVARLNGHTG